MQAVDNPMSADGHADGIRLSHLHDELKRGVGLFNKVVGRSTSAPGIPISKLFDLNDENQLNSFEAYGSTS